MAAEGTAGSVIEAAPPAVMVTRVTGAGDTFMAAHIASEREGLDRDAILDLNKTFEVLETLGVPVIAYGQDVLPAFWSATSDLAAPLRMNTAAEIARAQEMRTAMGLQGGQLVCNPIPKDAEIPAALLAPVIAQALSEADAQGINAKAVTPFLLGRIFELTEGRSLTANIALVRNNARLAAQIAGALAKNTG